MAKQKIIHQLTSSSCIAKAFTIAFHVSSFKRFAAKTGPGKKFEVNKKNKATKHSHYIWANYNDHSPPVGHPKWWWFRKGSVTQHALIIQV